MNGDRNQFGGGSTEAGTTLVRRNKMAQTASARWSLFFWRCWWALLLAPRAPGASLAEQFAAHDPGSTITVDHSAWDAMLKAHVEADGHLNRVDYAAWTRDKPRWAARLYRADGTGRCRSAVTPRAIRLLGQPLQRCHGRADPQALPGRHDPRHRHLARLFRRWPLGREAGRRSAGRTEPRQHRARHPARSGTTRACITRSTARRWAARTWRAMPTPATAWTISSTPPPAPTSPARAASASTAAASPPRKSTAGTTRTSGTPRAGIIAHLRKHADGETAARLSGLSSIDDYEYDWSLNDVRR